MLSANWAPLLNQSRRSEAETIWLRKVMVVALARKLLVSLWRYLKDGIVPQGAEVKLA
jgi:hypothetical protein